MSNPLRVMAVVALACAVTATVATPASAKSAKEVFDSAKQRYEKMLASIDNVTIVQDVMGMEVTTRMEKEMVDGHPILVPKSMGRSGEFGSVYRHFDEMAKGATVKGSEKVDGHACYAVQVKKIEGVKTSNDDGDFESTDGMMYFDEKDYILRRMVVNGYSKRQGEKKPVLMEIDMKDYREIKGWMQPWTTEMRMSGEGGMSQEDMAQMKQAMEDMEKQLAEMPEEQREMVRKMMKDKMPKMPETDGDAVTVTVKVKDVKVNTPAE